MDRRAVDWKRSTSRVRGARAVVGGSASLYALGAPWALPLGAVVAQGDGGGFFASMGGPVGFGLVLAFLVLSLAFHEASHAWVAYRCGDTTARDMGRLTLNPVPHIDPLMTIFLPLFLMATAGFAFGGAKPVPVLFHRLRHPWRDMMLVALAGPASNLVLAMFFMAIYKGAYLAGYTSDMLLPRVMMYAVYLNLILAIFNMIPIPPLDGSRVLAWALPESMRPGYVALERFGFMIVVLLLVTGVFGVIMNTTLEPLRQLVYQTVSLGGVW